MEVIDGPVELKPLHDYQENVTDRIKSLLRHIGPDRGMVSADRCGKDARGS
ncbi:hypothetical protein NKG05_11060 [Oerskovia sp. M15]